MRYPATRYTRRAYARAGTKQAALASAAGIASACGLALAGALALVAHSGAPAIGAAQCIAVVCAPLGVFAIGLGACARRNNRLAGR